MSSVHCSREGCACEKANLVCANCKTARYCSKDCQLADWKSGGHKQVCKPILLLRHLFNVSESKEFRSRVFQGGVCEILDSDAVYYKCVSMIPDFYDSFHELLLEDVRTLNCLLNKTGHLEIVFLHAMMCTIFRDVASCGACDKFGKMNIDRMLAFLNSNTDTWPAILRIMLLLDELTLGKRNPNFRTIIVLDNYRSRRNRFTLS